MFSGVIKFNWKFATFLCLARHTPAAKLEKNSHNKRASYENVFKKRLNLSVVTLGVSFSGLRHAGL